MNYFVSSLHNLEKLESFIFIHVPKLSFPQFIPGTNAISKETRDVLTELVNHYASRTLIVSCTKGYT